MARSRNRPLSSPTRSLSEEFWRLCCSARGLAGTDAFRLGSDSMFSMKGKVTAVTGGGGGIGFAAAEAIAEAGGDIALLYRSAPKMDERAKELGERFGVKVKAYQCEVTEHESVKQAIEAVERDFGRLDCYIANVSPQRSMVVPRWHRGTDP